MAPQYSPPAGLQVSDWQDGGPKQRLPQQIQSLSLQAPQSRVPPHSLSQMIPQDSTPYTRTSQGLGVQTEGGPMQMLFWQIQPGSGQAPQWTVPPQPS
jgi:hypothetical protein